MGRSHTFMDREFARDAYDPLDGGTFEPNLVFVIMSFVSSDSDGLFAEMREECAALGLRAVRVDERHGSGFIIRDVSDLIERAEFIVCDLTDERPNVYYELGYAHGVGNEANDILLVARDGTRIHFDVAPLRVHHYTDTAHLRRIIRGELQSMIDATRGK
jgi:hypothetical protein